MVACQVRKLDDQLHQNETPSWRDLRFTGQRPWNKAYTKLEEARNDLRNMKLQVLSATTQKPVEAWEAAHSVSMLQVTGGYTHFAEFYNTVYHNVAVVADSSYGPPAAAALVADAAAAPTLTLR